ncbi:MAG: hypothetical protein AABZ06_12250 [Bdellovibrionota bacterium]
MIRALSLVTILFAFGLFSSCGNSGSNSPNTASENLPQNSGPDTEVSPAANGMNQLPTADLVTSAALVSGFQQNQNKIEMLSGAQSYKEIQSDFRFHFASGTRLHRDSSVEHFSVEDCNYASDPNGMPISVKMTLIQVNPDGTHTEMEELTMDSRQSVHCFGDQDYLIRVKVQNIAQCNSIRISFPIIDVNK